MAELVHNCIQDSEIDNRLQLYNNIVLRCERSFVGGRAAGQPPCSALRPGSTMFQATHAHSHRESGPAHRPAAAAPRCMPASPAGWRRSCARCTWTGARGGRGRGRATSCGAVLMSIRTKGAMREEALGAHALPKPLRAPCRCRVLKGQREGLRRLKLRVEDPPRRRHMVGAPRGEEHMRMWWCERVPAHLRPALSLSRRSSWGPRCLPTSCGSSRTSGSPGQSGRRTRTGRWPSAAAWAEEWRCMHAIVYHLTSVLFAKR